MNAERRASEQRCDRLEGMFCLNLMRIALELARENKAYEGLRPIFQHYV